MKNCRGEFVDLIIDYSIHIYLLDKKISLSEYFKYLADELGQGF